MPCSTLKIKTDMTKLESVISVVIGEFETLKDENPPLLKEFSQAFYLLFNRTDSLFQVTGVDNELAPTSADELLVAFNPSDRFLMFSRAILARDLNLLGVN